MPSIYANYRFGITLLQTMPADARRTIQRFRRLFDMGVHGPDIFYYHASLLSSNVKSLGIKFHEQTGREFFQRVCRIARLARSEASQAYLYGLLCHYALDSALHPYIAQQAPLAGATQLEIETEFDRFLLEADGRTPPCAQDLSRHMHLTPGECEAVARFYSPATEKNVKDSVAGMAFTVKLLATPEGARRTLIEKSIGLLASEYKGIVMTAGPNPKCAHLNTELLALYRQAQDRFPEMLAQLQAHMTYAAPFEIEFDPIFG